jgi:trigger factor
MNRLIGQAAQQYQGKDRERFIQYIQQEPMAAAQLRAPLYEDKVVDFLFSKAQITDRAASREELEADLESEDGHVHGPDCGHDHAQPAAKPAKGKGKKAAKADDAPAKAEDSAAEGGTSKAGNRTGTAPAKAAKGKPAPDKVKLTEDADASPKPAKPLKNEPANKAAAKAADEGAAKKPAAKKAKK